MKRNHLLQISDFAVALKPTQHYSYTHHLSSLCVKFGVSPPLFHRQEKPLKQEKLLACTTKSLCLEIVVLNYF